MKRSLLAVAVLGAFSGVAMAQSSVTIYGRVDLSVVRSPGSENKDISNGSGSRLGFRGVEDLGGGLQALFNLEHRFDADTGAVTRIGKITNGVRVGTQDRFWGARSIVGLQGGFGQIVLGREYTTAFLQSQVIADPWGWDTVVSGSGTAQTRGTTGITGGGLASVRNDSSVTYKISVSGFTFGAQIAEATDTLNNESKKPWNTTVSYAGGPITAALSYERSGAEAVDTEYWATASGAYNFGPVKIGGLYGRGTGADGGERKSYLVTATAPIGAGELRAAYGQRKGVGYNDVVRNGVAVGVRDDDAKGVKTAAVGYHYSLSKRTVIYADFVRDSGTLITTSDKNGYDVGLKHNF